MIFQKVENKASVPQSINDDLYDEVNHSLELELKSSIHASFFFWQTCH